MPRTRPAAQMHGNIGIPASTRRGGLPGLRTPLAGRAPVPLAVEVDADPTMPGYRRGEEGKGRRLVNKHVDAAAALCAPGIPVAMPDMPVTSSQPRK